MKIEVGYGAGTQCCEVPEQNIIKILHANEVESKRRGEVAVRYALANPVGSGKLYEIVSPGEKIVILTSDISRPMPTWEVMPAVLDDLYFAGVSPEDITLVFARGSHRAMTDEERRKLAGDRAYSEIRCVDSDPEDCVHLGTTKRGTPIDITRIVAEADRRICLGNIEYHYFAGYSGGVKAVMPGASTPAAIQINHSMMLDPRAHAGNIEDNPIRDDLEEGGAMCGIDFILNVVLDEHKNIMYAVAGDVVKAHREGCAFLDSLYKVEVPEKADIVIVSQGGAPKDANLYQTQKALDNSRHVIKDGGTIILAGACNEGMGSAVFEEWMTSAEKPSDLTERIRREFVLGGHKAAAIAQILDYADITLISEMDPDFVRSIFMRPCGDLQQAFDEAVEKHGKDATVIVMPFGGATLPAVRTQD